MLEGGFRIKRRNLRRELHSREYNRHLRPTRDDPTNAIQVLESIVSPLSLSTSHPISKQLHLYLLPLGILDLLSLPFISNNSQSSHLTHYLISSTLPSRNSPEYTYLCPFFHFVSYSCLYLLIHDLLVTLLLACHT